MNMLYAYAVLCAMGMVGRDDDQPAKRVTDAEMLRITAALQGPVEGRLQLQGQFQLQAQVQVQLQGQVEFHFVMVDMRRMEEQRVQETRRARIAEAKTRSTVEIVGGPVIGDAFRSSRRRTNRP